jgi:RNA recognition motif-containing protein
LTEEEKAAKKLKRDEEDKARAAKRAEEEKTRDARTVFVSQLQVRATEKDVKKFFEKMAGKVRGEGHDGRGGDWRAYMG